MLKKIFKNYWHYVILALSLLGYFFWAYTHYSLYRYQISPDELSYIGIAQKYILGHFKDAVNGYWGPLISWCMVPVLKAGFSALTAMKVTTVAWGGIALTGVFCLAGVIRLSKFWISAVTAASIYWLLYFAYYTGTPDIIVVALVLWYLTIIYHKKFFSNIWMPILAGLLGGMLYLAKSYGLLFFGVHFIVFGLTQLLGRTKQVKKLLIRQMVIVLSVLAVIAGTWSALISYKYGHLTIGTSSAYNHALMGPEVGGVHPMYTQGFLLPPDKTALSAWEDPTYLSLPKWSAFSSRDNRLYQWNLIVSNAKSIYDSFLEYSFVFVLIAILIVLTAFSMKIKMKENFSFHLLCAIVIYISGYLLVLVEPRYFWPLIMVILIAGVKLIQDLTVDMVELNKISRTVFTIVLLLFMAYWPFRNLSLIKNSGNDVHDFFIGFEEKNYLVTGKVASSDEWAQSLYLCYYRGVQFYGVPKPGISDAELEKQLADLGIDYYFQWGDMNKAPEFLRHKKVLNKYRNINILQLK